MSSKLYFRTFLRTADPDYDTEADSSFIKANFTDRFGIFLQQPGNANIFTFDKLIRNFWNNPNFNLQIFAVADGCFITYLPDIPWFNNHLRFLAVVTPKNKEPFDTWTILIVGSKHVTNEQAFLQVASWDDSPNVNQFRFYGKDNIQHPGQPLDENEFGWTYQGKSSQAFDDATSYLGPFNGHVNGAVIMKELQKPWYHWSSGFIPTFTSCFSPEETASFSAANAPYLTGGSFFSNVSDAQALQTNIIEIGVTKWYDQRCANAFLLSSGLVHNNPVPIKRWMAHFLLTTTINIVTSLPDSSTEGRYFMPNDHIYNSEMLGLGQFSKFLPDLTNINFTFTDDNYVKVVQELDLVLMQEYDPTVYNITTYRTFKTPDGTLGGGKQTAMYNQHDFVAMQSGEGPKLPFVILQGSLEDAQGAKEIQPIVDSGPQKGLSLLSQSTLYAIFMIDFWNPVYSWRRGVLMQYVPETTTYNSSTEKYDLEDVFIGNIKKSTYSTDPTSPEYQFLELLTTDLRTMQSRISFYARAIQKRLKTYNGLLDHMKLVECRRRIYRPLPLDEFGYTLPYALKYDGSVLIEMTGTGVTQPVPARGVTWLNDWRGTLWGNNPQLIPVGTSQSQNGTSQTPAAGLIGISTTETTRPTPARARGTRQDTPQILAPHPLPARTKSSGCPFARTPKSSSRDHEFSIPSQHLISTNPTWADDISPLFAQPYWLPAGEREKVGSDWIAAMQYWGANVDLSTFEDVKTKAIPIYTHLAARSMPLTDDPSHYFPDEALEIFRAWVNQGCRKTLQDPIVERIIIPTPSEPVVKLRIRKDLRNLTPTELQEYRAKIDDVLGAGLLNSKWQELGFLHAEWCLHYQEATFLWHRAYLRYVEELIDFPIPYWNCFATDTSDPNSPFAGLPKEYLEESYTHPNGETRKNPLKYALSLDGLSKTKKSPYVTRYPVLVDGASSPGWDHKIHLFQKYQEQIKSALAKPTFSYPMSVTQQQGLPFGTPWANLPAFLDDQPDDDYPYRALNFDGAFEQPHDNYHGWVGPDMADNAYTAFDPVFLNFHANLDRIVESYIRSNPGLTFTSNYPLRPFTSMATSLDYREPREFMYTTIGDMAKPTQAIGYMYALPASPDSLNLQEMRARKNPLPFRVGTTPAAAGLGGHSTNRPVTAVTPVAQEKRVPYVIFTDVVCSTQSYQIDVFVQNAASLVPDPVTNQGYVGRLTMLGMGPEKAEKGQLRGRDRCGAPEQRSVRILEAERVSEALEGGENIGLKQVVTDLGSGEVVEEKEWRQWKGFEGKLVLGNKEDSIR